MALIVMLAIISLFWVWIYHLKQEVRELRTRSGHPQPLPNDFAMQEGTSKPIQAPTLDGVQTWILE